MVELRRAENAPTRALLKYFDDLHVSALGVRAVIQGGKDAKLIAGLWRSHGDDLTRVLIVDFFQSRDPFIASNGYTVGVFLSQAGKLLARRQARRVLVPVDAETWAEECRRLHGKTCGGRMAHADRMAIDADQKAVGI